MSEIVLGRRNLLDAENLKEAKHQLDRAGEDPSRLATWAREWGGASVQALRLIHREGSLKAALPFTTGQG